MGTRGGRPFQAYIIGETRVNLDVLKEIVVAIEEFVA